MMVKLCTQLLCGEKQSYELQCYDFPGSNEDIILLLNCITVAVCAIFKDISEHLDTVRESRQLQHKFYRHIVTINA